MLKTNALKILHLLRNNFLDFPWSIYFNLSRVHMRVEMQLGVTKDDSFCEQENCESLVHEAP
jgi:hypothetical protein